LAPAPLGLWRMLGLALLGGLALNLMPCVFPVLAVKTVGLAGLAGARERAAAWHAASYTAGVLAAFAGLGSLLLALRAAGGAAGWGFQFQSPVFVALTAWVLFAVGLNLSGVFEVSGGRFTGAGQSLAAREGHAGSFFTGLLAVLVATPCTAPFMGAAVAGALAAFPMYGAVVWLVWVTSQQAGPDGVLSTLGGLLLLGLAGWALGLGQRAVRRGRGFARGAAAVALLAAAALLPGIGAAGPGAPQAARSDAGVEAFSAARLAALQAEHRPVFVDMTAAWCVTCLVNERVALAPEAVRRAFAARGVVYLKGDWTRQNPEITAFLRDQGRDGVPLYVFYPADGGAARLLPQILTEGIVLRAIGAAAG
jgi:thiol:disulfide interchange protein DsbD